MRGVAPLAKKDTITPPHKTRAKKPPVRHRTEFPSPVPGAKRQQGPAQIDRRTEDRLRRGEMEIEGRLDLHGLNRDGARDALERFIAAAVAREKRCLLVITGKGRGGLETGARGNGAQSGESILRRCVPEWLAEGPAAPFVLRVCPARPRHGGTGAFYVLLRRKRTGGT